MIFCVSNKNYTSNRGGSVLLLLKIVKNTSNEYNLQASSGRDTGAQRGAVKRKSLTESA